MSTHEWRSGSSACGRTRVRVPCRVDGPESHRTLQRRRPPRSSLAARCRTGRPPVSVTRLVPSGSTTMPKRRTSGGKAAERAEQVGERRLAAADEEREAACREPACWPAARTRRGRGRRSRRGRRRRARGGRRSPDEAWVPHTKDTSNSSSTARTAIDAATAIAASKSSGSAHESSRSSTTIVAWLRRVSRYWRTSRDDSPRRGHHLRRRAPVDVAQVVTGDVLPQGVEGQVALADRVGRDPFEVAQQSGAERLDRHQVRTHEHLAHRRPDHVAGEDARPGRRDGSSPGRRAMTPRRSVRMVNDSSWVAPGASELMP